MMVSTNSLTSSKLAWNSAFFTGDIFALVRWAYKDGLTMNLELGAPEFAAILTFCTLMLILTNLKWINGLRPCGTIF